MMGCWMDWPSELKSIFDIIAACRAISGTKIPKKPSTIVRIVSNANNALMLFGIWILPTLREPNHFTSGRPMSDSMAEMKM
jgi:hypothetical protein